MTSLMYFLFSLILTYTDSGFYFIFTVNILFETTLPLMVILLYPSQANKFECLLCGHWSEFDRRSSQIKKNLS